MATITTGTVQSSNTLAGLIRMNDKNLADISVLDYIYPTQFQKAIPWFPASNGTQHKWTVETALPDSAFRSLNSGVANAAGRERTLTADLKLLDGSFDRDAALAQEVSRGGVDVYMTKESGKALNSCLARAEYSLVRGQAYDAAGPDGLADLASVYNLAYNAGGSSDCYSVYFMVAAEDGVCGILGNGGRFDVSAPILQKKVTNTSTGAGYGAYFVNMIGYMALQVGGYYSVAVGYNFDSTKKLDDDAMNEIYSLFPSQVAGRVNLILMGRKALKHLVQSRTATNPTGAPALFPQFWQAAGRDIPIVISDATDEAQTVITTTTGTTTTTTTSL